MSHLWHQVKWQECKRVYQEDLSANPIIARLAYIYYMNEILPKLKLDEGINHWLAMSKAGSNWKAMNDKEKKTYNDLHYSD